MLSCFVCGDENQRRVSYGHSFGEQDPRLESYWQGGGSSVHEGRVPDHVKAAAARAEAAVMAKFKENQARRVAELDRQAAEFRQQQQRQQAQRRVEEAPQPVGNARVSSVRTVPPPAAAMPAGARAALPPRDSWQAPARASDAAARQSGVGARVSGAGQPSRVAGSRGHGLSSSSSSSSDPDTSDEEEAGESDSDDGPHAVARPSRSPPVRDSTPGSPLASSMDENVLAETRRVEQAIMAKFAANKAAREAKPA
jgi:hypothetical protein